MQRYLIWGLLILIFILFLHPFDGNGDFYHHIDTGRWILQNHQLPQVDSFTHTLQGRPWVAHSWAAGVILYLVFQSWGGVGISIIVALMAVLTFDLLYLVLKNYGVTNKINLLILFVLVGPIATRWPQRSEVFYYPLLLLTILIEQFRKRQPKIVYFWPLILWLWSIIYGGSVILGLVLITLFGLKQLWTDHFNFRKDRTYYLLLVTSYLVTYFNGYGFKTLFYFFLYIPSVRLYEGEWAGIYTIFKYLPTSYLASVQYNLMIYFVFLVFYIFLAIFSFKIIPKNRFLGLLSLAIFLPILAFRQLPAASILAAPLIALMLQSSKKWLRILALLVGILMLIFALLQYPIGLIAKPNPPVDNLVKFISEHHIQGKTFNHIQLGGFLTYHFYPQLLTFIDTRDDLFVNSEVFNDLYNLTGSGQSVLPILKKYQIDLVVGDLLTDNFNYRSVFYSPDWSVVYFSDHYFLAMPKSEAQKYNLPEVTWVDPYAQTAAKPGMEKAAAEYYQNLINSGQDTADNRFYLAESLAAQNQFDQANQALAGIDQSQTTLSPQLLSDKSLLEAENYLLQKNCSQAQSAISDAQTQNQNVLLFFTSQPLPSKIYKIQAFYAALCAHDPQAAQNYLNQYLNQSDVSPLEKTKSLKEFSELALPQ